MEQWSRTIVDSSFMPSHSLIYRNDYKIRNSQSMHFKHSLFGDKCKIAYAVFHRF